jgi:hypothetical protein
MINHAGQIKGDMGSELFLACQNSHFSVWPMGKPVSDTGVRMVCSENKYVMFSCATSRVFKAEFNAAAMLGTH